MKGSMEEPRDITHARPLPDENDLVSTKKPAMRAAKLH